jgi:hypothetical protein
MAILRAWTDDLLEGRKSGAEVASEMRAHYTSDCSLRSKISRVRSMYLDRMPSANDAVEAAVIAECRRNGKYRGPTKAQRRTEKERAQKAVDRFDVAFARLREAAKDIPHGPCRKKVASFVEAPLRRQIVIVRRHAGKDLCFEVSEVDDVFREMHVLLKVLPDLKPGADVADACAAQAIAARLRRNEQMMVIEDGDAQVRTAERVLSRPDKSTISELILALCAVSGRRFSEIANGRSTFEPVRSRPNFTVFAGQLKTYDRSAYSIPLLVPLSLFSSAIDALRARQVGVTELTNMQVSAKYQGNADEWVQRLFPDLRRPHDLRAMYASLVYKGFSCGRMTFNRVAMQCLGHTTLAQSLAYNTVEVKQFRLSYGDLPPANVVGNAPDSTRDTATARTRETTTPSDESETISKGQADRTTSKKSRQKKKPSSSGEAPATPETRKKKTSASASPDAKKANAAPRSRRASSKT